MNSSQLLDHPNFAADLNSASEPRSYRVLIIGSEPLLAMMLSSTLSAERYQIWIATSKEEALRLLATQTIDLILLDLCQADGNDYELCDELCRRYAKPVLAMSGCGETENILAAFAAGACGFIQKPFPLHALEGQIKQACKMLL